MELDPFIWLVVGVMGTFAAVLGAVSLYSRSK